MVREGIDSIFYNIFYVFTSYKKEPFMLPVGILVKVGKYFSKN